MPSASLAPLSPLGPPAPRSGYRSLSPSSSTSLSSVSAASSTARVFDSLELALRYQSSLPWYIDSHLEGSPEGTVFRVTSHTVLENRTFITTTAVSLVVLGALLWLFRQH
jgi:hypothetical protein